MNRMRKILIKYGLVIFATLCTFVALHAQNSKLVKPALIPIPVQEVYHNSVFTISSQTIIVADTNLIQEANLLNELIKNNIGDSLALSPAANLQFIKLQIDSFLVKEDEGYLLKVDQNKISIIAHDGAGVLYAIQTLQQLWNKAHEHKILVPGCTIKDYPRFAYRGMHLDVSRHFFSIDFVKKFLDVMAMYKFNNFHWHLTDDQGWRIEIKKYPLLQSVAAWRDETLIGHKKELPHRYDGKKYGGFYTQNEIKEVIQYAAARHINVIPEIEMPGHALAALGAYPSLGCTGGPYKPTGFWGVFDDVFCAGKDSTFIFLQHVLDEVMSLFPSKYIHIGGDECPKTRWKVCAACQKRMHDEGLENEDELQSYFIRRINNYIISKGRRIIGWDEILEGGLAPGATVMSWRGEAGAIQAAKQQQYVIMTPEDELYFDHYQSLYAQEPLAAGGYTALKEVYDYEPFGETADQKLLPYVSGVQGQVWSEYLTTSDHAEYMTFPRAIALAELAWSPKEKRNFAGFLQRLKTQNAKLKSFPINMANNFDEINFKIDTVEKGALKISLHSTSPVAKIFYTIDGSVPTPKRKPYSQAIMLSKTTVLKANIFNRRTAAGRLFSQSFHLHKAVGATVHLKNNPVSRFSQAKESLVNGVFGSNKYNDTQWLGFSGDDFEAVIDLGRIQQIRSVGANVLNYHWQKMWAPTALVFFISDDGKNFNQVAKAEDFTLNGINEIRLKLKNIKGRYIKIVGINKGIIPEGSYGAGSKSLLMIDEIIVE
ncbi:MAG: beta-hexosaminidase [Bacteroidia bacterium]|nr:MAG: beta-hexosaminidase [Bacteroidia bacterium]